MNINKILKRTYISIIIVILLISSIGISFATTESELKNQANSLDAQIAETNSEIAGVKSKMSTTLKQINRLNSQINSYEDEISELESQLAVLNTQIAEKEANILIQEEKHTEQQNLFNKRMIAIYESGTTSYLDMLLGSDGLADFISKYYLISQLAEYDQDLLQKIENTSIM